VIEGWKKMPPTMENTSRKQMPIEGFTQFKLMGLEDIEFLSIFVIKFKK